MQEKEKKKRFKSSKEYCHKKKSNLIKGERKKEEKTTIDNR
jgi:hypothetical protein